MLQADKNNSENKNNFRYTQLQDIEKEIPWDKLVEAVLPHYQSSKIGRLLIPVETMLRVYFLQQRYTMSSTGIEDALFQIQVLRDFALIDTNSDMIPNDTCIESFHSLVVEHRLETEINRLFNIRPLIETNGKSE